MVRVAKEAQDSLDKDSTFKERHRKKRDGQEARDKDRRPKKEAEETLFHLKHGQLRTKRCAAGNADSAKVYNRDFSCAQSQRGTPPTAALSTVIRVGVTSPPPKYLTALAAGQRLTSSFNHHKIAISPLRH